MDEHNKVSVSLFQDHRDIEIAKLKEQIAFIVETFAERDTMQRNLIARYEATIAMQAQDIAWFKGAHAPSAIGAQEQ